MGKLENKTEYENLRNARILENKARLASLGLQKTLSDLRSLTSSSKQEKTQRRKWTKRVYSTTDLRRSDRLKCVSVETPTPKILSLRYSTRLRHKSRQPISPNEGKGDDDYESEGYEEEEWRPANAPLVKSYFSFRLRRLLGAAIARAGVAFMTLFLGYAAISAGKRNCVVKRDASAVAIAIRINHALEKQTAQFVILLTVFSAELVSWLGMGKFHMLEEAKDGSNWDSDISSNCCYATPKPTSHFPPIPPNTLTTLSPSLKASSLSFTSSNSSDILPTTCLSSRTHNSRRRRFTTVIAAAAAGARTDYYSTLNVTKNASLQEIKTSYRKLARKYHPDMNKSPGADDKFKEISAAYEMRRKDRYMIALVRQVCKENLKGHAVVPKEGWILSTYIMPTLAVQMGYSEEEMKQDLDIRYDLYLSFEESIFGGQKEIKISCLEICDRCSGSGAKSSDGIKSCSECGGRGVVMKSQRTPFGMVSQVSTCSNCYGQGNIITDRCPKCDGNGKVRSKRSMNVVIPPGVSDGATMQVQGKGNFDKKRGLSGDLFIIVHIKEKHGIQRDGLDLYSKVSVDYTQAILGTIIKVETVEGLKDLEIPSGIQPGDAIKLSRMGVPDMNSPSRRGDHHFIVDVLIPKEIRRKKTGEKFASVSMNTSILSWRSTKPDSHLIFSFLTPKASYNGARVGCGCLCSWCRSYYAPPFDPPRPAHLTQGTFICNQNPTKTSLLHISILHLLAYGHLLEVRNYAFMQKDRFLLLSVGAFAPTEIHHEEPTECTFDCSSVGVLLASVSVTSLTARVEQLKLQVEMLKKKGS
ncbi:hypothetical protein Tsubulata_045117 [Turnera subulata]|uniref:J domain-containing protein n=1 Tax=Turnera subulata TaxID=218843 RepID=A0A9Q0FD46_9ROSI|nr:hypothetical protein Tsubulata_045117 [Turnera subulata]